MLSSPIFLFPYASLCEPVQATKLIDLEVSNFCKPTLTISCRCLQKRVWWLTGISCCTAFHLCVVISNSNYKKKFPLLVSPLSKGSFTITIILKTQIFFLSGDCFMGGIINQEDSNCCKPTLMLCCQCLQKRL